jgi:hypothetical protein
MGKTGLETRVVVYLKSVIDSRQDRDTALVHKIYQKSLKKLNKTLDVAIKEAENSPEVGISVARHCSRFVLESMPDLAQEPARANSLRQYDTLEHCLTLVRKPGQYLAQMQKQFGPNLDPRKFGGGDIFNTAIKSQRQRLYAEGQGFNTQEEKNFCRKRSELLVVVEKAYNRLRDQALGLPTQDHQKGLGR